MERRVFVAALEHGMDTDLDDKGWQARFEIGNDYIDAQHGMLLTLIGKLSRAIETNVSADRLRRLLQEIKKYAEFHFLSEENFMRDIAFDELTAHEKSHSYLLSELSLRIARVRSDKAEVTAVLEFLWHWLTEHIAQEDMRFADQARLHAQANPTDDGAGGGGAGGGRLRGKIIRRG